MTRTRPRPRDPRPLRRVRSSLRAALVWGMASAAFTVVVVGLARALGVPVGVVPAADGTAVTLGPLVLVAATLFAALVVGCAVGVLGKLVRKPVRWVLIGGAVVTLASLSAPLGQPDQVPAATRAVLAACQVVTGLLVTVGVARGQVADDRNAG